jgi:hypothetical protein
MSDRKPEQFLDLTAARLKALEAEIAKLDGKLVEQDISACRLEAQIGWEFAQARDKIEAALKACGLKLNADEWCKKIIGRDISTMRRRVRLYKEWPTYESRRRDVGNCGETGLLFALSLVKEHLPGRNKQASLCLFNPMAERRWQNLPLPSLSSPISSPSRATL